MTALLAVALGLLVGGVVGGLGGGGGALTVPVLVWVLDQPVAQAATGSAVIVGAAAVVGAAARARSGDVDWPTGLGFGLVGAPVAVLGSLVGRGLPDPVLLLCFAAVALAAAVAMLRERRGARPLTGAPPASALAVLPWAAAVGFLTGLLGVGGGFLLVPVLVVALRMPIARAAGTSLVVIALNAAAALVPRVGPTALDWAVVGPFALAAVAGTLVGKLVADRLPAAALTRAFAALIAAVGLAVGAQGVVAALG